MSSFSSVGPLDSPVVIRAQGFCWRSHWEWDTELGNSKHPNKVPIYSSHIKERDQGPPGAGCGWSRALSHPAAKSTVGDAASPLTLEGNGPLSCREVLRGSPAGLQ